MKKQANKRSSKEKPSPRSTSGSAQEVELLRWTATPFREEPKKGAIFVVSCLLFLALLYILYREIIWVVLAVGVLTAAYSSYIFPSHYRLTTAGVDVKSLFHRTTRAWPQYTGMRKHVDGVFLVYGIGRQSKLGHFLYFGDKKPEEVLAVIGRFIT
ncbi:MAG: hypothetical protein DDT37_00603 [Firmicutes bacterium]|nr:hypothetical protein [candidate division NPL-UPA2 bacterium]MBT9153581.1 hypothetical protein [candidate division NPL-UPA2 bacterium]MBT9155635.1 hypothetical protein [candidate division NPL-UPA2 bacterium]